MKTKKKLLYIHNADFNIINANKIHVHNMCNALNKVGFDVRLLTFGSKNSINKNLGKANYKINTRDSKLSYYFRSLILLFRFKGEYDIIYTRDLITSFLFTFILRKKNVIYELHEIPEKSRWEFLFKLTQKKLKQLVTITNSLKDISIKLGVDNYKIIVLPDGANISDYNIKTSKEKIRKELNLPIRKKIITYTGSFQDWKGYKTIIETSRLFKENEIIFLLVGGTKEQIKNLNKNNNYSNCTFVESVKPNIIPKYLLLSDILLLPNSNKFEISRRYTSPLKLFEYMASKRPIIASNLESIKEIVSDKEVLFFKSDNSEDLKNKIEILLKDKKLSNILIKNSFFKVKDYTWEKRAEKIKGLIANE